MKLILSVILIGGLAASTPALAQKKKATPEERFSKTDRNADGKIDPEEFKGKGKGDTAKKEKSFRKMDANGDGALSKEEFGKHKK
jgi:Ca2+-binding EF-hand superfamily protein